MKRRSLASVLVCLLPLCSLLPIAAAGCGADTLIAGPDDAPGDAGFPDDAGSPDDAAPFTGEHYRAFRADLFCRHEVACGGAETLEACRASFGDLYAEDATLATAIDQGLITVDRGRLDEVLDRLAELPCADAVWVLLPDPKVAELEQAYREALVGQLDLSGTCVHDEECQSGRCEQGDCPESCCSGRCAPAEAPPERRPAGEPCETTEGCAWGTFCLRPDGSGGPPGTCEPLRAEGEPCEEPEACAYGAFCHVAASGPPGVCYRPAEPGEPCDPEAMIAQPPSFLTIHAVQPCVRQDHECPTDVRRCVAKRAVGERCGTEDPSLCALPVDGLCAAPRTCVDWARCDEGTCHARPTNGQACERPCFDCDNPCLGNLDCAGGVCQPYDGPPGCR